MNFVLIDGNNMIYRYYHTRPPQVTDGERSEVILPTINAAERLKSHFGDPSNTTAIFVFDANEATFRHEASEAYKKERKGMDEELRTQEAKLLEVLPNRGFDVYSEGGIEADDVLAVLADHLSDGSNQVTIVTTDKDLLQLVDDSRRITVYNPMAKKVLAEQDVVEKMGVAPTMVPELLALCGDKSDGIIGVPGVAEKTAAKMLNEHKTLQAVVDASAPDARLKVWRSVYENKDQVLSNFGLTVLNRGIDCLSEAQQDMLQSTIRKNQSVGFAREEGVKEREGDVEQSSFDF